MLLAYIRFLSELRTRDLKQLIQAKTLATWIAIYTPFTLKLQNLIFPLAKPS